MLENDVSKETTEIFFSVFAYKRKILKENQTGTKLVVVVVVVVVPFFFVHFSFANPRPRLRSAFGLASLGIIKTNIYYFNSKVNSVQEFSFEMGAFSNYFNVRN